MKKILVTIAVFGATMAISAQETVVNVEETVVMAPEESFKPEEGSFAVEVGFAPLQFNSVSLQGGQLKASYSLNEQLGVRLGVGFGINNEFSDNKEEEWTKTTNTISEISVTPGVTYSFEGTNKLAPYIGAELLLATTSDKETVETKSGYKRVTKNENSPFNTFGLGIFTGFNYYFAKNLYLGVEVGIGAKFKNLKNESDEITENGTTTTEENKSENGSFNFSAYANPALRLGWAF
ncbi:MAG: porin family protein [Prevotellaceae bacterium]|jgi:outer membrane protein W|nr:porin family protein [Prevotellaceae bacterium]